jgi:hypothetical protein
LCFCSRRFIVVSLQAASSPRLLAVLRMLSAASRYAFGDVARILRACEDCCVMYRGLQAAATAVRSAMYLGAAAADAIDAGLLALAVTALRMYPNCEFALRHATLMLGTLAPGNEERVVLAGGVHALCEVINDTVDALVLPPTDKVEEVKLELAKGADDATACLLALRVVCAASALARTEAWENGAVTSCFNIAELLITHAASSCARERRLRALGGCMRELLSDAYKDLLHTSDADESLTVCTSTIEEMAHAMETPSLQHADLYRWCLHYAFVPLAECLDSRLSACVLSRLLGSSGALAALTAGVRAHALTLGPGVAKLVSHFARCDGGIEALVAEDQDAELTESLKLARAAAMSAAAPNPRRKTTSRTAAAARAAAAGASGHHGDGSSDDDQGSETGADERSVQLLDDALRALSGQTAAEAAACAAASLLEEEEAEKAAAAAAKAKRTKKKKGAAARRGEAAAAGAAAAGGAGALEEPGPQRDGNKEEDVGAVDEADMARALRRGGAGAKAVRPRLGRSFAADAALELQCQQAVTSAAPPQQQQPSRRVPLPKPRPAMRSAPAAHAAAATPAPPAAKQSIIAPAVLPPPTSAPCDAPHEDDALCVCCLDEPRDTALPGCGAAHPPVMCAGCAVRLLARAVPTCPVCRRPLSGV